MMSLAWVLLFVCSVFVFGCCCYLVFAHDYNGGVLGTVGLGMLGLGAFSRCVRMLLHFPEVWVTATSTLVWIGLSLFLARYLCVFLRRRARRDSTWYWAQF